MKRSIFCILLAITILLSSTISHAAPRGNGNLQMEVVDDGGGGSGYDELVSGSAYDFESEQFQFKYLMGGANNIIRGEEKGVNDAAYAYYSVLNNAEIADIFNLTPKDIAEDPKGWLFDIKSYTVIRYNIRTDEAEIFFNVPNVQQLTLNWALLEVNQGYVGTPYNVEDTQKWIEVGNNSDRPESGMKKYGFNIPNYVYGGEYPIVYMDSDGILPNNWEMLQATGKTLVKVVAEALFDDPKTAIKIASIGLMAAGVLVFIAASLPVGLAIGGFLVILSLFIADANEALEINLAKPPKEENYNSMKYLNNTYGKLDNQRLYNFIAKYWDKYVINNLIYTMEDELAPYFDSDNKLKPEYKDTDFDSMDFNGLLTLLRAYHIYKMAVDNCDDDSVVTPQDFEKYKEQWNKTIEEAKKYIEESLGSDTTKPGYIGKKAFDKIGIWEIWLDADDYVKNMDFQQVVDSLSIERDEYRENINSYYNQIEELSIEIQQLERDYYTALLEYYRALEELKEVPEEPKYPSDEIWDLNRKIGTLYLYIYIYENKIDSIEWDLTSLYKLKETYAELGIDLTNPPTEPTADEYEKSEEYKKQKSLSEEQPMLLGYKTLQKLIYLDTGHTKEDSGDEFDDCLSAEEQGYFPLFKYLWVDPNQKDEDYPDGITGYDLLFGEDNSIFAYCYAASNNQIEGMYTDFSDKSTFDSNYPYIVLNAIEQLCEEDEQKYSTVLNSIISEIITVASKSNRNHGADTISYSDVSTERTMPYDITTLTEKERTIIGVVDPRVEIYKDTLWGSITTTGNFKLNQVINLDIPPMLLNLSGRIAELTVFINGLVSLDTFDEVGLSPADLWNNTLITVIFLVLVLYVIIKIFTSIAKYMKASKMSLTQIFSKVWVLIAAGIILFAMMYNPQGTWNLTKRFIGTVGNVGEKIVLNLDDTLYELKGSDDDPSISYWASYFDLWTYYNTNHNLTDKENKIPRLKGYTQGYTEDTSGLYGYTWLYGINLSKDDGIRPEIGGIHQNTWSVMLVDSFLQNGYKTEIDKKAYRVVDNFLCPIVRLNMAKNTTLGLKQAADSWIERFIYKYGGTVNEDIKNNVFAVGVWQNPNYNGLYQGNFAINKMLNILLMFFVVVIKLLTFIYFWYKLYTYIFSVLLSINSNMNIGYITKETFKPLLFTMAISLYGTIIFYISLTTSGIVGIALTIFLYWISWRLLKWWAESPSFPPTLKPLKLFMKKKPKKNIQEDDNSQLVPTSIANKHIFTHPTTKQSMTVYFSEDIITAMCKVPELHISNKFSDKEIDFLIKLNVIDSVGYCLMPYVHSYTGVKSSSAIGKYKVKVQLQRGTMTNTLIMPVEVVKHADYLANYEHELD